MKNKYKFRPGDELIYKPIGTPYVIIKVYDDNGPQDYKMAIQNASAPKIGNQNTRFIHYKDIFVKYEPKDPNVKLLYGED